MRRITLLGCFLFASAAFAQNNRSAVSRNGLDTNPCTVASPCRSFQVAIGVTQIGGEVVALDSGGYGTIGIQQSLTIGGAPGVHAAITTPAGSDGVGISAPGANVVIHNLTITGGSTGIGSGEVNDLYISDCLIRGVNDIGIFASNFSGVNLVVERTTILDVGGGITPYGMLLRGSAGHILHALVHDCLISNSNYGVWVDENASVMIAGSTITDGADGVFASAHSGTGAVANVIVEGCTFSNNTHSGVRASSLSGSNFSNIYVSNSLFVSNVTAMYREINGTMTTFGNNRLVDNSTDSFPAPATIASLK